MGKKIEVKVSIHCEKCRSKIYRAVTKLAGIDQVAVDVEKGMLTVIGNVDPVLVISRVRKLGKVAEIISVGSPRRPDPDKPQPLPSSCNECQPACSYETAPCNIL